MSFFPPLLEFKVLGIVLIWSHFFIRFRIYSTYLCRLLRFLAKPFILRFPSLRPLRHLKTTSGIFFTFPKNNASKRNEWSEAPTLFTFFLSVATLSGVVLRRALVFFLNVTLCKFKSSPTFWSRKLNCYWPHIKSFEMAKFSS